MGVGLVGMWGMVPRAAAQGGASIAFGAQAIGTWTRVDPMYGGRALSEGYLTQPAVMAHGSAFGGRVSLAATLNLEGLTLRRGELDPGIYGEGYVDRRHPHTYVHEVVISASDLLGRRDGDGTLSLSAGRGFVPFGTDDPMSRPFVKYPVNHHLSQILERQVAIAAYRRGPVMLEASVFNGDEPVGPSAQPEWRRFGDSRALRATGFVADGIEVQGSWAFVASPEFAGGAGLDQRKWSASARYERAGRYGLVEWARSTELDAGHPTFSFHSVLAEGAVDRGGWRVALRGERTVRPEEERLLNPFRSERPHSDFNLIGTTRWLNATAGLSRAMDVRALRLRPFAEFTRAQADPATKPAVFDPAAFYGSNVMWSLSLGMKFEAGAIHRRMGRYGAAMDGHAMMTMHDDAAMGGEHHHH